MNNITNFGPNNGGNKKGGDEVISPRHDEDSDADNDETTYGKEPSG